jgi:glutamyl-tRNA reductase
VTDERQLRPVCMDDIAMVHLALQKIDEENMRARRNGTNASNTVIDENLKNAFEGMRRLTVAAIAASASQLATGDPARNRRVARL